MRLENKREIRKVIAGWSRNGRRIASSQGWLGLVHSIDRYLLKLLAIKTKETEVIEWYRVE